MAEFFNWLSSNPTASTILIVAFGVVVTIFVIAFLQGRSISIWPPSIGEKPKQQIPGDPARPSDATQSHVYPDEKRDDQHQDNASSIEQTEIVASSSSESPAVLTVTPLLPKSRRSRIRPNERRYGQHQGNDPPIEQPRVPSFISLLAPDQLHPRSLLLKTRHSSIEKVTIEGTKCVIKSSQGGLVDLQGLKILAGQRISAYYQKTSVSIATPVKVWLQDDKVCELQPFYEGITLYDVIRRNKYPIQGSYLGIIFNCTVRALSEFHSLGLLHRDVNPSNMLITKTGDIVLLDVSFACRKEHQNVPVENPSFSAPEQSLGMAEPRSDFYSLAASVFFLANGVESASCATEQALQEKIGNINFGAFGRPSRTNYVLGSSWGAWELIEDLLNTDVSKRPGTSREILLDPGTFITDTSLYGVLDLDKLGFLLLYPSGIFIGSEKAVIKELNELMQKNKIEDAELHKDVSMFLSGQNPWLLV